MSDLNRVQVGDFSIENAIKIEDFKKDSIKTLISIEEFFKEKDKITLNSKELVYFFNGVKLTRNLKNGLYRIYNTNMNFIGIGIIKENSLKRDIIV